MKRGKKLTKLLEVKNLKTYFYEGDKVQIKAVDGISFDLDRGEILGIVGESGSGKTVLALSILRLIEDPGKIVEGEIFLEGKNLLKLSEKEMQRIRGREISIIFQDPAALNPVLNLGTQIGEMFQEHLGMKKREAKRRSGQILKNLGLTDWEKKLEQFPHQLSGGMKERVMIAMMALTLNPKIIIGDEPTTALDTTLQALILKQIREKIKKENSAFILISHNLGIVAEYADKVVVMYLGRIMEKASVFDLFYRPLHPYTLALIRAIPRIDIQDFKKLYTIPGEISKVTKGCNFAPRCQFKEKICEQILPSLKEVEPGHWVACHFWKKVRKGEVS